MCENTPSWHGQCLSCVVIASAAMLLLCGLPLLRSGYLILYQILFETGNWRSTGSEIRCKPCHPHHPPTHPLTTTYTLYAVMYKFAARVRYVDVRPNPFSERLRDVTFRYDNEFLHITFTLKFFTRGKLQTKPTLHRTRHTPPLTSHLFWWPRHKMRSAWKRVSRPAGRSVVHIADEQRKCARE